MTNLPANARDTGSIPRSGRSSGGENDNHSCTLVWKISWTEEPGELQSMGLQRVNTTEQLSTQTHTHTQKEGLIFEKLTKEKDGVKGNICCSHNSRNNTL